MFALATLVTLLALAPALPWAAPSAGALAEGKEKKPDTATGIEWEVTPGHVLVFLDGKKIGEAGGLKFTATSAGKHSVKLMNGKDETEMEVSVKKGQTLKFSFAFDAG